MTFNAVIRSVAHSVPEQVVTNDDLAQLMDTSDQWIRERTGIAQRRFVERGTPASALALPAAQEAITRAAIDPAKIDLLVAATLSPDYYFPGIGTQLQHALDLPQVPALDIRAQCSGLVYGLSLIDAYISAGRATTVLLICAEVQSPCLDLTDRGRDMAVLFGDGAGALVLTAEEGEPARGSNSVRGIIDSQLGSDGSGAEVLCMKIPGSANPGFLAEDDAAKGRCHPSMDGRQVFKHAVSRMGEAAEQLLQRNGVEASQVDLLLPHQANLRINEAVRERLGLATDKVFNTIQTYGNTTSATIPIGMSVAQTEGKLNRGDLLLTLAFGAGFTWGANLIRW